MPSLSASETLLEPLARWFHVNRRDLPWRAEDLDRPHPNPYAVLVSELMLQQTQVATVVPYYLRWMEWFPDPGSLAAAGEDEIHKLWEGLGYYRRARFLQKAARTIAQQGWPQDLDGLLELPGLGPYTAAAIASIAFQRPEPALDGNAFRVLARLFGLQDDPRHHADALRRWLRPGLQRLGPSRITQGIMELGAVLCGPRADCGRCPLSPACEARRLGITDRIPPARTRADVKTLELWLVALHAEGHRLLLCPSQKGLLSGLWRWPSLPIPLPARLDAAAECPADYGTLDIRCWTSWTQVYSHRREIVLPVAIELPHRIGPPPGAAWVRDEDLAGLPLGKRDQKLKVLLGTGSKEDADRIPAHELIRRVTETSP